MRYPWETIDGYRFESLAFDYVQDRYPAQQWAKLPLSGDGNRDMEARSKHYFLGQDVDYSVWVEAKYTRSLGRALGKGRLDPTLVSALIEPNVGAVLFISNGRFNSAYITRAERALRVGHIPTTPSFIDGEALEHWLNTKPKVAQTYFSDIGVAIDADINISHQLAIRSCQMIAMNDYRAGHIEIRKRLTNKEEYVLQLLLASEKRRIVAITAEGSGLVIEPTLEFPTTLPIREGLTPIALRAIANRQTRSGCLAISVHCSDDNSDAQRQIHYSVAPSPIKIRSASQLKALQAISQRIDRHQRIPQAHSIRLIGAPAAGKTWVLSRLSSYVPLDVAVRQYTFMDSPTLNAQCVCRALLFMTFGTAFEFDGLDDVFARSRTEDVSSRTLSILLDGAHSPQRAAEAMSVLLAGDELGPIFTRYSRGDAKILVLDDIHKADMDTTELLIRLLTEFGQSANRTLLILSSRGEDIDPLAEVAAPSLVAEIAISSVTKNDIQETLYEIIGAERANLIGDEMDAAISNILELRHFAEDLNAEVSTLKELNVSSFMARCRELIRGTTIVSLVGRLRTTTEYLAADLIMIAEGGVSVRFVEETFGDRLIGRLVESGLVRKTVGESPLLFPAHDLLKEAYLARRQVYSDTLGGLLDKLMLRNPEQRVNLLGHLCSCGAQWRSRYLSSAIELRDDLISQSRFGAARSLAETLYSLVQANGPVRLGLTDQQHLETLYAHADCNNHTRSAKRALAGFKEVIAQAKRYASSATAQAFLAQATAETFNARFWLLDVSGLLPEIDTFLHSLKILSPSLTSEWRLREGRFTALNRKMMLQFLLDDAAGAEKTFDAAIALAEAQYDLANRAHLLMDKAKSCYLGSPESSLKLLKQAASIYRSLNREHRRQKVCASQIAFLKNMLETADLSILETAAEELHTNGYAAEYSNALLEQAAVNLVIGRSQVAAAILAKVGRQANALESPRRLFLYHHLCAVLAAFEGDANSASQLNKTYIEATRGLGVSYLRIAEHNNEMGLCRNIAWAHANDVKSLWIDNRLW